MYADAYFPKGIVDKVKAVLLGLCAQIEASQPLSLDQLYAFSHAATERINELAQEFEEHGSEIETAAREAIADDFRFIADSYGFAAADIEQLIAPRDW